MLVVITSAKENATAEAETKAPAKYTQDELNEVQLHLVGLEEWFGARVDKQKDRPMNQDPILLTKEVDQKGQEFQDKVLKMLRKKPPVVKKSSPKKKVEEEEGEVKEKEDKEEEEVVEEKEEKEDKEEKDGQGEGKRAEETATGHDEL